MKTLKMNIFAARFLYQVATQANDYNLPVMKLRRVRSIQRELEKKIDPFEGKYELTKSTAEFESDLRVLLEKTLPLKSQETIDRVLVDYFKIGRKLNLDKKVQYAFEDTPIFSVRTKHWEDPKHPQVELTFEDAEFELIQTKLFSEDSEFTKLHASLAYLIDEAIRNAKEGPTVSDQIAKEKKHEAST